jgi:hypothetical protein
MPKSGFLRHLKAGFLILVCFSNIVAFSQTAGELARLYRDNRILELGELRKKDLIKTSDWKIFVDALFETDGEKAIQKMLQAYSRSNDSKLKGFIRHRVSQFYSARGYYETSRRILDEEKFFEGVVSLKQSSARATSRSAPAESAVEQAKEDGKTFGVQVGAYSTFENARQASQKYLRAYPNTKLLNKVKNGINLYVIVVGGYPSREEAAAQIDKISEQFKVKGYIIQY